MRWTEPARHGIDETRLRAAIEAAERRTAAEIMVSIAPLFLGSVPAAARRAFDRLGVARTRGRNGVLIFLVPARRQVVVLGDEEVEARAGVGFEREAADRISAGFRRGDPTGGLIEGVERLVAALEGPFPWTPGDRDELPAISP